MQTCSTTKKSWKEKKKHRDIIINQSFFHHTFTVFFLRVDFVVFIFLGKWAFFLQQLLFLFICFLFLCLWFYSQERGQRQSHPCTADTYIPSHFLPLSLSKVETLKQPKQTKNKTHIFSHSLGFPFFNCFSVWGIFLLVPLVSFLSTWSCFLFFVLFCFSQQKLST